MPSKDRQQMVRQRAQEALGSEPTDLADHIAAGIRATVDETRADERARVRLLEVVGVSARLEEHRRAVLHRFADLIRAGIPRDSLVCALVRIERAQDHRTNG